MKRCLPLFPVFLNIMASNILRRSFASSASSTVKIGLIPADGIGKEGK